jgi:hypothetical protein
MIKGSPQLWIQVKASKCSSHSVLTILKGSTLLYLPRDIIRKVFDGVDGMNRDYNGDYTVPCESKNLPDITLHMGENSYTIKPEHYVIRAGAVKYHIHH